MKKYMILTFLLTLMTFASMNAQSMDKLWKSYEDAMKADKPKSAMTALEQIKSSAAEKRLAWDYYQACVKYVECGSSMNWKDSEKLREQLEKEVDDFDEPVLTFYHRKNTYAFDAPTFIGQHKERLKASFHKEFAAGDQTFNGLMFSTALTDMVDNDYEYALWSCVAHGDRDAKGQLEQFYGGRYPEAALLEFATIGSRGKDTMSEFAARYKGKAVGGYAEQELLSLKFRELELRTEKKQEDYIQFRKECGDFVKAKEKFSGEEKKIASCATMAEDIIAQLDEKQISFDVERGVMTVSFKNVDKVDYVVKKDDKKVLSGTVKNPVGSYFLKDIQKVSLQGLDDGEYLIELSSGKLSEKRDYSKHSISIATKRDAKGHAVYVADAWSGEPIKKCDIALYGEKEKLLAEVKDVTLSGFTYLPESISSQIKKSNVSIVCSYTDASGKLHSSRRSGVRNYFRAAREDVDSWSAVLIQDRAAFHPGESAHFKAIIYHGDHRKSLQTADEGTEVTVSLYDPQHKLVESQKLKTNEFGSVAGQFLLPTDRRKGEYEIKVESTRELLASSYIQVDEYVLPTFTLTFDRQEKFYFPGDEVRFSGVLKSYSGHSLSGADVRYSASVNHDVVASGKLSLKSDGSFSITVPKTQKKNTEWYSYATVTVSVTDATGETLQWQNSVAMNKVIRLNAVIVNENQGDVMPIKEEESTNGTKIITDEKMILALNGLKHDGLDIEYSVFQGKVIMARGKAQPGQRIEVDFSGKPSGLYHLELTAQAKTVTGELVKEKERYQIVKISESDKQFSIASESVISLMKGSDMAIQIGAGLQDIWASVELIGEGDVTLRSEIVHIAKGEMKQIRYSFEPSYSNRVLMRVLYFCEGKCQQWSKEFVNETRSLHLPLAFSRFVDKASPGQLCSFEITTLPNVECAVSVFDKSTENIQTNFWKTFTYDSMSPTLSYSVNLGIDRSSHHYEGSGENIFYRMAKTTASASMKPLMVESAPVEILSDDAMGAPMVEEGESVLEPDVREDFAGTISFQPFLRSDADGKLSFEVTGGDLLSTFYVYVYGHDKQMRNATLREEMLVSVPVKLSVVEPQHLYTGDKYVVKANLSSTLKSACTGTLSLSLFDGKDYKSSKPFLTKQIAVNVPAGGTAPAEFEVNVPALTELGMLLKFTSASGSDAVFTAIPVSAAKQTLTEAHSAVLHPGDSEAELEAALRAKFVNVQGSEADMKLISLLGLVKEALPELIEPEDKDVLTLVEALYARLLSVKIGATATDNSELIEKILKCQNSDGGFGWFEGMGSSGIITAQVLKMAGTARERGLELLSAENVEKAVKYLDKTYFSKDNEYRWFSRVSCEQYVYIRAMFPQIEFKPENMDKKVYRQFRKDVPEYLVPRKERGLNGVILAKARRLRTLMLLNASEEGIALAKDFGIKYRTSKRLSKSTTADLASLLEYAVEHSSGGMYYPNAVMPFRGLLESELEAHSLLCDLLRDCRRSGLLSDEKVSDGIRLWMMIQKETQQWAKDPAYVEAIASVLDGSDFILDTKVMSLSKTYTVPFELIQKSGNGMSVSRSFFLLGDNGQKTPLAEGDALHVGDKVEAEYSIWSEENRSFVHLNAGRPASLRPVNQLSGRYGWWLSPLRIAGLYSYNPQGYREVGIAGSEYWFDSYPEEKTTLTEEFFVTQEGSFQMPVVEIECLYAPHYRANDAFRYPMVSESTKK